MPNRKYESLAHAVASNDQEGSFDAETFCAGVAESLKQGYFRLVFVLDETPEELTRLVNYLETISDQLVIDLITISAYTVHGSQILVPQRVEAEPQREESSQVAPPSSKVEGRLAERAGDFIAGIDTAPEACRPLLHQLANWAVDLELERLVKLKTYHGKSGILTLLPRLVADDAGLVSIYNKNGVASLQFWRTVFERCPPMPLTGKAFRVPDNVYVIGTMNTADRSIALLDTALRRRFGFIELMPDSSVLGDTVVGSIPLGPWLHALNERICDYVGRDARNLQIGHSYLLEDGRPIGDFSTFVKVMQDDILPLLEEYCYEDYTRLEKILGPNLVDKQKQQFRQELFDASNRDQLIQALLAPCPDIIASTQAVSSEVEAAEEEEEENSLDAQG